ncbi:putative ataxin-2 isoform X1 [Trypanosoma theileri]|uniref:Putative ataxin-2 isoform X1 n=1 Tax=Trypanosoma theileri TaxID=67003 RepID=A0A1X0NQC5_9TRYP|nr:putative ataxin-2 isoform X1 [Trypanosoma theileri]ORC86926.1 putative ataxin-2 isoform X1 [Trypanosoma theileri]
MEASYSSNADRLQYLYLNLVGHVVQVRLVDGTCVEGLFMSRSDVDGEGDSSIMLCCTRYVSSAKHKPLDPSCVEFEKDTIIPYRDIVMVEAQNVKIRTEAPGRVDERHGDLSMNKFDWADDGANELLDNDTLPTGSWDQFEVNEKAFGVKTTYKEELYTTRLDHSKITEEQRAHADRVAREIEVSTTRGIAHRMEREEFLKDDEGRDEGTLYSDVQRPQKEEKTAYAPPTGPRGKRGNEMQQAPPPPPQAAAAAVAPAVNAATATGAGAASLAEENAMRHKRAEEEKLSLPHDNHPRSPGFNPAATPYTPMKPGGSATVPAVDFLTALANAVSNNDLCFTSPSNWPGGASTYYDQDDSSYSQHSYETMAAPGAGPAQPMFMGQQPPVPPHHRSYQNAGTRMNPNPQMPMHHMHAQQFHQQHHQHHQHHQAQQQQQFHGFGNYVPPQHHTPPMQDYGPSRGGPTPSMRNQMRPQKNNVAPRPEPQQPVSTNTAVAPPPLPAVESAPPPAAEVRPTTKLQRGRGAAAVQRGDVDGGAESGGGGGVTVASKKRGGK